MDDRDREVDEGWRLVSIGVEGDPVDIEGVNPWRVGWTSQERKVTVSHPQYPSQRHTMSVYEVETEDGVVVFAAGEFSASVWGFYVPTKPGDGPHSSPQ